MNDDAPLHLRLAPAGQEGPALPRCGPLARHPADERAFGAPRPVRFNSVLVEFADGYQMNTSERTPTGKAMSIAGEKSRMQVCCDTCPARYPNTYAAEDFNVMISDARTAGWQIRKAPPAHDQGDTSDLFEASLRVASAKAAEPFTHTCPSSAGPVETGGLF